jgi:5-methylcytosine-specific restriction endonuclease McrA
MGRRGRQPHVQKVGLTNLFETHARKTFHTMQGRLAERVSKKTNRIIRPGRTLPFSQREWFVWVKAKFNGDVNRPLQCPYCSAWIHCGNYSPDHNEPLAYGGSIGLDNLILCCFNCNMEKGKMGAETFKLFRDWCIYNLPARDCNDIFGRLRNGAGFLRLKWRAAEQAAKTSRPIPPIHQPLPFPK